MTFFTWLDVLTVVARLISAIKFVTSVMNQLIWKKMFRRLVRHRGLIKNENKNNHHKLGGVQESQALNKNVPRNIVTAVRVRDRTRQYPLKTLNQRLDSQSSVGRETIIRANRRAKVSLHLDKRQKRGVDNRRGLGRVGHLQMSDSKEGHIQTIDVQTKPSTNPRIVIRHGG